MKLVEKSILLPEGMAEQLKLMAQDEGVETNTFIVMTLATTLGEDLLHKEIRKLKYQLERKFV